MSSSGLGRLPAPGSWPRPRSRMSRNMDSSSGVISGSSTPSRRCPGSGRVRISSGFSSVLMPLAACGRHAIVPWGFRCSMLDQSWVTLQSSDTACGTSRCPMQLSLDKSVQEAIAGRPAASQSPVSRPHTYVMAGIAHAEPHLPGSGQGDIARCHRFQEARRPAQLRTCG